MRTLDTVNAEPVAPRHRSLRWLVPVGITVAMVLLVIDAVRDRDEAVSLPSISPQQLVAEARNDVRPAFSGTALAQLTVGSPVLEDAVAQGSPSVALGAVPSGSHTVRIWYADGGRQRVALVDPLSETDLFRVGTDTWAWSSARGVAVHGTASSRPAGSLWTAPVTPVDLADRLLTTADVESQATVAGAEIVAGRPAYGLVLRPTSPDSLVDYAHIAVDGSTKTPLAVQIYPRDADDPAVDVSFTNITFGRQPSGVFTFHPPAGATVRQAGAQPDADQYGSGWSAVLCYQSAPVTQAFSLSAPVGSAKVRGSWGRGQLVQLPLLSELITSDGRTFIGPVAPKLLYAAAAAHPARP